MIKNFVSKATDRSRLATRGFSLASSAQLHVTRTVSKRRPQHTSVWVLSSVSPPYISCTYTLSICVNVGLTQLRTITLRLCPFTHSSGTHAHAGIRIPPNSAAVESSTAGITPGLAKTGQTSNNNSPARISVLPNKLSILFLSPPSHPSAGWSSRQPPIMGQYKAGSVRRVPTARTDTFGRQTR